MDFLNSEESHLSARRSGEGVKEEFINLIGNLLETNGLERGDRKKSLQNINTKMSISISF